MIFEVSHRTSYRYAALVNQSQHVLHLAPRQAARQSVSRHSLIVEPAPSWRNEFTDYFGNPVTVLGIDDEHDRLLIHARSTVSVDPRGELPIDLGRAWNAQPLPPAGNGIDLDLVQFALPSPATPASDDVIAYAAPSFLPDRPVLSAAWDLVSRIHAEFKFDPSATDVTTPVSRVLQARRGVCQDFAHLALACLRAFRIPARYVSGYLLTRPPAGQPRLQGADASHAWLSVWTSEHGWVDLDPTNRAIPSDEHIVFAYGREYADISPVSGVLLGGGDHVVDVAVDVVAVDDARP